MPEEPGSSRRAATEGARRADERAAESRWGGEIADIVDERDRIVGRAPRSEVRARRLLHRSIAVLCHNGAGEVFVHRRTDSKDVFPAMYDMFVAGMVLAGESYAQAAERELHEELGIQGVEPRFLFKHLYRGPDNPNWSAVFEITWDRGIAPLRDEIAWGAFMARDELARRLDQWPFVPDGLEIYRRYLKTQT